MSMNVPENNITNQQPEILDTTATEVVSPDTTTIDETTVAETAPQEQATNDTQVVETVAQGLANDEVTAEDIFVAMLSEQFGISPSSAVTLLQLLLQDMMDDTTEVEEETEVIDTQQ